MDIIKERQRLYNAFRLIGKIIHEQRMIDGVRNLSESEKESMERKIAALEIEYDLFFPQSSITKG